MGIPAGLALTSHMINENILISFFPNHQYDNQSNDPEEEIKFPILTPQEDNETGRLFNPHSKNSRKHKLITDKAGLLTASPFLKDIKEDSKEALASLNPDTMAQNVTESNN